MKSADIYIDPVFYSYYQKSPIRFIDVGASGGLQPHWQIAERFMQVIFFEPDAHSFNELQKRQKENEICINSGLYKRKEDIDFYLMKKRELSSVYKPNVNFIEQFPEADRFDITEVVKIKADCLDSQLREREINDVDFLKLDTQGGELNILEGADQTLEKVVGLEIEVEFNPIYEDQPTFAEIDQFVRAKGFQLFDLRPHYWKRKEGKSYGGRKGQLIFADAVYLLSTRQLSQRLKLMRESEPRKVKLMKLLSISFLYGYYDFALALFNEYKTLFSNAEIDAFEKRLSKSMKLNKIPEFKGRRKLSKLFKILYNTFRPTHNGWAVSEDKLGNLD